MGDDDALAGRQAVGLDDHRQRALVHVGERRLAVIEYLEGGCGDPVPTEKFFAEDLAALELGSSSSRPEDFQFLALEEIDYSGDERRFRSNDCEVDRFFTGELQQLRDVFAADIDALGFRGDPGIARGAVDLRS